MMKSSNVTALKCATCLNGITRKVSVPSGGCRKSASAAAARSSASRQRWEAVAILAIIAALSFPAAAAAAAYAAVTQPRDGIFFIKANLARSLQEGDGHILHDHEHEHKHHHEATSLVLEGGHEGEDNPKPWFYTILATVLVDFTSLSGLVLLLVLCKSAHPSTLYDNHQCDFHLCYIVNHDLILRLSANSVIGILRRCGEMGTCHPKTSSSLENIMNTKMQDCRSISERRTSDADNNWVVGEDLSESIRRSFHERRLTRHKDNFTSLLSNKLESETTNSSMSSLSCSASHMDDSDDATDDIESGIFELEL
jgi:hypothetical protein